MTNEVFYEYDLGGNIGYVRFKTVDDATKWLEDLHASFTDVIGVKYTREGVNIHRALLGWYNGLQDLLKKSQSSTVNYSNFVQACNRDLGKNSVVNGIFPGTQRFAIIKQISEDLGHSEALAAAGYFLGISQNQNIPYVLRGITHAICLDDGLAQKSVVNLRAAMKKTEKTYRANQGQIFADFDVGKEKLEEAVASSKASSDELETAQAGFIKDTKDMITAEIDTIKTAASAAITEIEATEKKYIKQMELEAPAKYWTKKAVDHITSRKYYVAALVIFIIAAAGVLNLLYRFISTNSESSATATLVDYAPKFGISFFVITLLIWVARILVRLYLSEHHLAVVAKEKAIMITTYLSLSEKGEVKEEDRKIILEAIFTRSSDGIVKDDAAPMIGVSSLIRKS